MRRGAERAHHRRWYGDSADFCRGRLLIHRHAGLPAAHVGWPAACRSSGHVLRAGTLPIATRRLGRLWPSVGFVPRAWRNLVANKPRLLRSSGGIGFAVLLMLMQLGFERAFFNASLDVIRLLDGDIFLQSASKYRFATRDPFPASELDAARSVSGVANAWPLYADWFDVFWKNPANGKIFLVRTLAFDPDHPVLRLPEVEGDPEQLREPETALVDRGARRFLGMDPAPSQSELNGVKIR